MPTFGQLRTQARSLETETETLLSRYAGFAQSLSASVMEDENKVVKNIEENLRKVIFFLFPKKFFFSTMLISVSHCCFMEEVTNFDPFFLGRF